jgi:hypothetical protein
MKLNLTILIISLALTGCERPTTQQRCNHKFSNWGEPITHTNWNGSISKQFRSCSLCGEAESRMIF